MKETKYYINRDLINNALAISQKNCDKKFKLNEMQSIKRDDLLLREIETVLHKCDNTGDIEYNVFMQSIRKVCEPYMHRLSPIVEYAYGFYNSFHSILYRLKYNGKEKERD